MRSLTFARSLLAEFLLLIALRLVYQVVFRRFLFHINLASMVLIVEKCNAVTLRVGGKP